MNHGAEKHPRKPVIVGSLLTLGTLFGAYLGYVRPPAAFAASCGSVLPGSTTTFAVIDGKPYIGGVEYIDTGRYPKPVPNALDHAIFCVNDGGTVIITTDITINNTVDLNTSVTLVGDDSDNRHTITINTAETFYADVNGTELDIVVQDLDVDITDDNMPFIFQYDYFATRSSSLTITNVSVTGGRGVVNMQGGGDLTLSNVDVSSFSNTAVDATEIGNIRIDSQSNIHDGDDGAVSLSLQLCDGFYMLDSTISSTRDSHAWIYLNPGRNARFKDSDFTDHTISDVGLAILGGSVTLDNFTFADNERIGSRGNAMLPDPLINMYAASNVTVNDSTFTRNTSVYDNRNDLMYVELSGTFTTSGQTTFSNNGTSAKALKSALYVKNSNPGLVNISDASFTDNYVDDASLTLAFTTDDDLSGTLDAASFSDNAGGTNPDLVLTAPSTNFIVSNSVFSSRSALNVDALASLGSGNTFTDEAAPAVPGSSSEGSSSTGTGASTTAPSNTSIAPVTTPTSSDASPSPVEAAKPTPVFDPKAVTSSAMRRMSPREMASISPRDFAQIPAQAFRALTPRHVRSLTTAQIRAMRPAQVSALRVTSFSALTPPQMRSISPRTVQAITPNQVRVLSTQDAAALTKKQLAALRPRQVTALTPRAAKGLSTQQIEQLPTSAQGDFTPSTYRTLTWLQQRALRLNARTR